MFIITNVMHQNYCEKSDWSTEVNQNKTACEPDIINAIFAVFCLINRRCLLLTDLFDDKNRN